MSILGRTRARAFTLLEVMIAVLIISMLMFGVYRFVKAVLVAVNVSAEATVVKQEMAGFINYLQVQLEDLPTRQQGVLAGTPHKYHDLPADELEWLCPTGHGVLTTAGADQYRVTLALQNAEGKTSDYEIGLRRRTVDSDERNYHWLPLLRPAIGLEIRYFEPRGKLWIDAWKDPVLQPSLIRVRVWRVKGEPPYEAILPLPAARLQTL